MMPIHVQPDASAPLIAPFFRSSSEIVISSAAHAIIAYAPSDALRVTPDLAKVREALQNRIVARRLEQREQSPHRCVDDRRPMRDVEIERNELAAKVKLRVVI